MNTQKISKIAFFPYVALTMSITTGCTSGGGVPSRKKMPEFNTSDGIESPFSYSMGSNRNTEGFNFSPVNTDLTINGRTEQAVAVALPDYRNDSLAISLLRSFRPMALPLLSAWAQQQRHSVELDLRAEQGNKALRTEFSLGNQSGINVPIVLLWDQSTVSRFISIKKLLDEVPELQLTYRSGDDPAVLLSHIK